MYSIRQSKMACDFANETRMSQQKYTCCSNISDIGKKYALHFAKKKYKNPTFLCFDNKFCCDILQEIL